MIGPSFGRECHLTTHWCCHPRGKGNPINTNTVQNKKRGTFEKNAPHFDNDSLKKSFPFMIGDSHFGFASRTHDE